MGELWGGRLPTAESVFHAHTYLSCVGLVQSSFSLLSLLCVEFACMIMYTVSKGFSHPPLDKTKMIVKNKQENVWFWFQQSS